MCGIAGIFDFAERGRGDRSEIELMTATVAHRGPDGCEVFVGPNLAMGFRRLAIIDRAGGQQPIWNERRSIVLVCNGEIFNHVELRERLERRHHRFRSQCDVEVLVHLYEECGSNLLQHLNGQFAFALYDFERKRLFAARDQFGVVPFFYTIADGLFLFASEAKALLQHSRVSRSVDLTGLDQALCFPGVVSPTTMFAGIRSLSSGHAVCVSANGVEEHEYWDLDYPLEEPTAAAGDEREWIDALTEQLQRSVNRRLMSEVPLGVYLSGGLDSAVVAGMASASGAWHGRRSFGVSFPDREMSEQSHQQCVATFLGTQHHDVCITRAAVTDHLADAIYHAECPIKESYNTACLALSQTAKAAGVSVILTGQGADELFGGYIGYRIDKFNQRRTRPTRTDERERTIRQQLWGDPTFGYDKDYAGLDRLKQRLYSPALREMLPRYDCFQSLALRKDRVAGRHLLHKRSYLDVKLRLADHLLGDHGDRMAMANGVELRHPFLDSELIKFVARIPPDLHLREFSEKHLLRRAAAPFVPPPIVEREKFGWFAQGAPQLLRQNEALRDLLSPARIKRQGYFDAEAIGQLMDRYAADDFELQQPFEADLVLFALSFSMLVDIFKLPSLT